ncbi:DUF6545 domain-containing protein [Streptomyces sp. H27-C3]|uniref:DUF6545 domain-containing protein n=1 Tax=Streptomyces sp. H27-C3 TaxID=3046305 RepID=UPI0024BA3F22|nr:DUF6545 domain-containing protein [Streptomyces sp. H27-C3]MDJ0466763.1 regulator component [Streptomyces sp. H27-C3]
MTANDLAELLSWCSVIALWTALLCRARPALREQYQRGLWLAILTAALALTLFQPAFVRWAIDTTGSAPTVALARNLTGVLSAGLTLLFIVDSTRGRRLRYTIAVCLTAALAILLVLDQTRGSYAGPAIPPGSGSALPSTGYWLIVIGTHLVADIVAIIVCWQYSRTTDDSDLVWSLRLFAFGSILAVAFWGAYLVHLFLRIPAALPYMSVVINIHGLFRAASLLVPVATAIRRTSADLRTAWVLWPLWRDLLTAVPHVAFLQPQPTRIRQVLLPGVPLALLVHRQTIETYDALLDLQAFVQPSAYGQAYEHAQRIGIPGARIEAAALAGALGQARRAKLADQLRSTPHPMPGLDRSSPATLLAVARAWPAMADVLPGPDRPAIPHHQP